MDFYEFMQGYKPKGWHKCTVCGRVHARGQEGPCFSCEDRVSGAPEVEPMDDKNKTIKEGL